MRVTPPHSQRVFMQQRREWPPSVARVVSRVGGRHAFFSRRFSSTISATSCFRRPFSFRRSVTSGAVASEPVADQPSGPCSAVLPDSKYCDQESGSEKTAKQHIEDMGVGAKGHAVRPANRSLVFFRLAVLSREQPLDRWFSVAVITRSLASKDRRAASAALISSRFLKSSLQKANDSSDNNKPVGNLKPGNRKLSSNEATAPAVKAVATTK